MFLAAVVAFAFQDGVPSRSEKGPLALVRMIDAEWSEIFKARGLTYISSTIATGEVESEGKPHPPSYVLMGSSGTGFIILDDRFALTIDRTSPGDADTLNAFLLAHEAGHHVQAQTARTGAVTPVDAASWELQADCFAGAILARLNRNTERQSFRLDAWDRLLPALLLTLGRRPEDAHSRGSHGFDYERVAAISSGAETGDPAVCGFDVR